MFYDFDVANSTVWYQANDSNLRLPLPLDPMHGTVGVAPAAGEARSALAPGDFGGKMDLPEMRVQISAYVRVIVPGAFFSMCDGSDLHGECDRCLVTDSLATTSC